MSVHHCVYCYYVVYLGIKLTWAVKIKYLISSAYVAEYYILVWYYVDSEKLFTATHLAKQSNDGGNQHDSKKI